MKFEGVEPIGPDLSEGGEPGFEFEERLGS